MTDKHTRGARSAFPPITPCTLASSRRWVAWQTELRDGKPTKVPYDPNRSGRARSDAPSTWGTRAQAERRLAQLQRQHGPSGTGIMLGASLNDGSLSIGGIDLDSCRDPDTGELAPWAREVADRFGTYSEVSPSGTGIKLIFVYDTADLAHVRAYNIVNGRTWKHQGDAHPPAIELHLSHRYFAVTDLRLAQYPAELRLVPLEDLVWLIRDAGPRFIRLVGSPPPPVVEVPDIWMRVEAAALTNPRLARLLRTDFADLRDRSRSGIAFALADALRNAGFSQQDTLAALHACPQTADWAREKGEAHGGRELRRVWDKVCAAGGPPDDGPPGEPPAAPRPLFRSIGEPEPYPVWALGPVLGPAANAVHELTQAPDAICAQSVLGVAALAVQAFADVRLPTGETRPISLFLLTIAASGERKSSTDNRAMAGVREREREMAEGYDEDLRAYANDLAVWKRERERILGHGKNRPANPRQVLDALGPEPRPPIKPLIVVSEPTWEGLVKLLPEAEPSLGLFSAEGGGFLCGHGMTEDARIRTAAGLSEAWDGTPIKRVRGGDGTSVYRGRRLSVHLLVQPEIANELLGDEKIAGAGGQGLVSRFLIVAPESNAGERPFREPDPTAEAVLDGFAKRITWWLAAPKPLAPGQRDVLLPRVLHLTPEARARWIVFHNDNERELGEGGAFHPIAGFANKVPELAARIAAVLTLIEENGATEIGDLAMSHAIELMKHYRGEALRLVQGADVPLHLRNAEKLRVWLLETLRREKVSLPDVYQFGPYALRTEAAARDAVAVLERHGWLVPIGPAEVDGKRRREVWRVVASIG